MWLFALFALLLGLALFYVGKSWAGWAVPGVVLLFGWWMSGISNTTVFTCIALGFLGVALATGASGIRRRLLTSWLMPMMTPLLPRMSETEREAIDAGTVWWEAEFFTGRPNWRKLLNFQPRELTEKEEAFLAGPCEEICRMVTEWDINKLGDLPAEVWDKLKSDGFMGMIIPEEYGGLGFSAAGHSRVVTKLASRSTALAVTVMVPNSLGPAELLLHYGTDEQKDHYLPRLARGEEVPGFALTEPNAGSDAGSMTSRGVVCEGTFEGKTVLGMRLTWDKRYITLAPVASVLGLAFKLEDPDQLLGYTQDLGITCALIPTDIPGVEVGERHDPLGTNFMNGPTRGTDVFVPLDYIIGGAENAGKGWLMLMQSLAAGRGISLPSMSSGAAQLATRTVGAYATVRKQFNMSIGKFEGIEAPLAKIGAYTYAMEACRRLTAGAVDAGEKPSVASAIVKCYLTEGMRDVMNDAMDIVGGAGISLGPRNIIGTAYAGLPIGITVEGANILTRSMIIFGQGAIRCHPYVQDEMKGAFEKDTAVFDPAFFGHVGFVFQNSVRSFVLGLTDGYLADSPVDGEVGAYYRKLSRMSSAFALTSDFAMGTLGGALKRKEAITGRLADALAWMFIGSAALQRFHHEGSKARDLPFVQWILEHALYQCQEALAGVTRNLPLRPAAWYVRALSFPLGTRWAPPSDRLTHRVAKSMLFDSEAREHLTSGIFVPGPDELGLGTLEAALDKVVRAQEVHDKLKAAVSSGQLEKKPKNTLTERALEAGVITDGDLTLLEEAEAARDEAVAVDAFTPRVWAEKTA